MSFIGSMFDPSKGAGFQAGKAPIVNPTDPNQISTAYGQTQQGLGQQQNFVNALQGQNGIGNQSSVFNQLQGVANGTGPNPAQAMLAQSTGQNVAQQGALAAGQRGGSANVGMLARQAGMAGTNAQQQAAGQAATMQANQSLGALGQLGGIAGQQVAQQQGALSGYNQAAQNQQANLLNAQGAANNANVAMQSNINNANAGIAGINAQNQGQMFGGLLGGLGAAAGIPLAHGGAVPRMMADGGYTAVQAPQPIDIGQVHISEAAPMFKERGPAAPKAADAPEVPNFSAQMKAPQLGDSAGMNKPASFLGNYDLSAKPGAAPAGGPSLGSFNFAKGGKVPALLSPGERYLPPDKAQAVAKGKADPMKEGRKVPGKAKVAGDSLKNDTVKATLQEGGVVIPRSVMQSKDPHAAAAKFVAAHIAKMGMKKAK